MGKTNEDLIAWCVSEAGKMPPGPHDHLLPQSRLRSPRRAVQRVIEREVGSGDFAAFDHALLAALYRALASLSDEGAGRENWIYAAATHERLAALDPAALSALDRITS